jgi:hypothetical protein
MTQVTSFIDIKTAPRDGSIIEVRYGERRRVARAHWPGQREAFVRIDDVLSPCAEARDRLAAGNGDLKVGVAANEHAHIANLVSHPIREARALDAAEGRGSPTPNLKLNCGEPH